MSQTRKEQKLEALEARCVAAESAGDDLSSPSMYNSPSSSIPRSGLIGHPSTEAPPTVLGTTIFVQNQTFVFSPGQENPGETVCHCRSSRLGFCPPSMSGRMNRQVGIGTL